MSNADINKEYEEVSDKNLVNYREQVTRLTEVIEALQNVQGSSFWKVLEKNIFDFELAKSKRRLEGENNPTEIYRLQGEIKLGRRFRLEKILQDKLAELQVLRKKL